MAISAATAVALVALVYRVTLNLPDMPYSNDLRNKSSPTFAEYSQQVIDGVDFLLKPLPGFHSVSVREFRYQAVVGTMTILDVISMNTKGAEQAKKLFKDAIEAGHIGWLDVAPEGFEFHVIPVNSTSDGKYDFSFARPTVTCPDGSIPEYSLHGSTYCWSHSVCPAGTACIQAQCCKTAAPDADPRKCPDSKWECGDGTCLSTGLRCDGLLDCDDRSDELMCLGNEKRSITHGCTAGQFQCESGACIEGHKQCDRKYDCEDGTDETKCDYFIQSQQRHSATSTHAPHGHGHQGHHNQTHGHRAPPPAPVVKECNDDEFRCPYLQHTLCLHYNKLCDGVDDCGDNSDEQKCESGSPEDAGCAAGEFECENGQCIPGALKCDRAYDCEDGTDETTCDYYIESQRRRPQSDAYTSPQHQASVNTNTIVDEPAAPAITREQAERERLLKEREHELARREHEERRREAEERHREAIERRREEEEAAKRRQEPSNSIRPAEITFKEEYDDENCLEHEFMCSTGECIDRRRVCDTREDCLDGSDEHSCHHTAAAAVAPESVHLPPPQVVDEWPEVPEYPPEEPEVAEERPETPSHPYAGAPDVSHLSDADDLQITVYPHEHTVREGRDASFECRARTADNGVYPQVRWTRVGGPLPEGAHESGGRLSFASVGAADGGRYVCIAQHNGRVAEAYAILNVNSYGPQELAQALPQGHGGSCMSDERACGSNECVKSDYVCDGEPDCRDQSDEQNCPAKRICEPNEFRCNNDRCIQKMWLCDGDDDCGDNSDELNCGERKPGDLCQPTEFRCRDGRQCVPQSFQCDGTNDCQDGSDEVGCVQPTVVEPPDSNRQVPQGDTFQLTCRAVAVPEPYINWRLNWGPVCEPPRCVQESEGGVGTLTVHNAQPMDQGAYTCEAINVKGRVLATPDCIVRIVSIPNPPPPTRPPPPPAAPQIRCDPTGSTAPSADASRGCPCKPLVTGPNCDQCRPGSFHLNNKSPTGCLKCFCFGITDQCRSSDWYRTQDAACEKLFFNGDSEGVILTNLAGTPTEANFEYNLPSYLTNSEPHRETLYWNLPLRFKGDKVSAYGGEMSFQLQFSGNGPVLNEPLVVLKGNGITLVHRKKDQYGLFQPDRPVLVTVETYETNYERENGTPATREDLLMVLADLDAFQIRATHVSNQISTSLGDVSWEIAVNRDTQGERALEVEQCSCPPGYVGLSCEDCAPGYERSGHGPYLGTCVPVRSTPPPQRACPPGAISPIAGYDGSCECKPNLSGPNCDQCAASTFNYKPQSPQGCLKCFCSGVTNQCRSSSYRRAETSIDYRRGDQDQLEISIADVNSPWTPQTQPDVYDRAINFGRFDEARGQTLYWKLPAKFLGDKVTSYGGKLSYTFKYSGNGNQNNGDADVILKGNEITIQHRYRGQLRADTDNVVEIPITEEHWERNDGQPVTREHLLMALADLDTALIKLSYLDDCATSSLISVTLEHAEPYGHGGVAADVEHCSCPEGYVGTSCEDCAPGYRRTGGGLYLGLCERCECNGHATSCDTEYGHCLNCQHNTEGDQCERCAPGFEGDARRGTPHDCRAVATKPPCDCNNHSPRGCDSYGRCLLCEHNTEGYHCESCKRGYYGDATRGSPYDCTPCPCPGSSDCFVGPDGQVKCRNCPAGYSGDRCTECAPGYTPSANTGGRECEPIGRVNPNDITFVEKPKAQLRVQIYPPQHLAIKQGSRAKWTCVAQGYRPEEVTIQWSKVGSNTLPPHVRQIGNQLLIESVTPEDIGQYRCTGTVADNIATDEGSLQVESGTPPTPIVTPPFQSVPENGRAVFECIVPGYTSCEISWHKDEIGNPLPYGVRKTGNKIIIHSANREHVGNYYCTVRTPYGPGKSNPGRLEVERKQWRPETDPPSLDVEVGNPARFHCFVRGVPHAIFEWRREDGAPLDSNVDQAGGYLTVLSAQQHHSGRYICAAQDPQDPNQGPIDAPPVQLNVRDRPAPPVAPPAPPARAPIAPQVDPIQQTVDQGTPAQFRCWVEGNPSAQVRWTAAGNRPLPQGARDDRGTLVFSSVTQNDAGEYICSAYDPETRNYVPSQPARLDVRQPSHPPQVDPPEQTVDENTPSAIRCWVPGNPAARLSWARRGGAPLPPDARDDGRGNLNIAETKTLHEGDYECTAVDPNTNVPQTSQPARINVRIAEPQVVHPDTGSPPHPVATPPVITVKKGEPARFHCDARSETPADIHWTYGPDRGPLRGDAYQEGDDIVIDSSDDTNAGEYHCTATNAYGTGNAEPVRLVVTDNEEPPTARVEPRVFNGKPGDRHQFKCHTTGIPPPQVSWTGPNDGPLPAGATDLGDGVLDIVDARKDHEGDYTCHAVNIVGEAEDHGSVHIGPSLTVRTDPAGPRIVLTVGEPLEIKCEAVGDPDPDVEWLHDPGPERGDLPDDFQPVTISEQYLRHPHIGLLNAGKYTCRGSNEHASATKDIYIEVVEPSHVATVSILGGNHQWFALDQPNQLVCASTGQSLVDKVEWVKVDDSLPSDIEDHNEQGLLHFGTFKPDYAGEYECRGFRKNELIGSAKVNIHAEGSSSSHDIARVDISPPTIRVVNEGDSIILDCNVRGRKNPTSLTWKHYAKLPKKSHYRQSKITIHTPDALGGHKRKRPIELEDANGSGKYLQIRGARLIDAGLYTVIANMSDGTALVAAPSWLVVKPRGHEGEVTYQWDLARGGNLVRQLGDQQELSIKSADPSQDYGVYRCTVEDADGNTVGTAFSAVSVGFSSNEKAEEAKFEETSDAELVCPVYAVPGSTIIWRREGDSDLPSNAEPRGNKLLITEFDESSAGLYTCTMQIDQFTVEGHVNAQILVPDTTIKVDINVSNENVAVGDRVWLDCIVVGDPEASIEYEKEGSDELPAGAQLTECEAEAYKQKTRVTGKRLLFNTVSEEDTGTYICKADTTEGRLIATAKINVGSTKLDTRGDTVAPPDPSASSEEAPTTTAEPLPAIVEPMTTTTETTEEIKTSETVNVIEEEPESSEIVTVQPSEDPPTTVPTTPEQQTFYTATPDVLPETTIMPIERESLVEQARRVPVVATHGTETKLKCPTYTSDSAAEITWEKIGEQMPLAYHIADGSLILTNASKEDAGIYQCSVRQASGAGTVSFVDLRVAEFVPSFRGKNVIELPPLTDHDWKELDLELSIKPSSRDGVIFHTTRGGQDGSTPEQYHTVSLRHGKVVYESKLTQGPPEVLESENIVRVGKWSKIRIQNTPDELSLRVNTDPAVMAAIPSEVVLSETPANNVFVGGDPDDDAAGHKFVGVISRLLVGHKAVPFSPKVVSQSVAARTNVELEAANECASMPCQNEGICLPAQVHEGFICECSELFHGTHCQFKGRKCANGETCENGACVDVAESNSAKCVCPIDKEGVSCEEPVSPRRKFDGAYHFNGKTSYLAIPPPSSVKDFTLSMNLHVKDAVKNQIVAYLGSHYNQRTAEYMSIAIKNGRLVNSYQNGAGKSEIESLAELEPGRTYHIQVSRTGHMAEVSVNGMKSTSRLKTVAFPSGTSVFIGGFPPGMQPRKQVAVMEFFNGCISEVELDAVRVDIDSNLGGGVISGDLEACNSTSLSTTQVTVEDEENDFDVKSEEAELTETPEEESEEEEEEPSTTAEPSTTTELPIVAVPTNLPHGGGAGGGWDSEEIEPAAIISENGAEVSVVPTDITNEVETTIRTGVIVPVKLPQEPISAEVTPPEAPEPYTTVLAPIDEEGDEVTVGAPLTTPEPVPINLPMSVDEEVEPPLDEDDFEVVDLPSTIPTEESVDASTTSTTPSPYALCETMTCGEHGECTVVNSTTVACQCMDYYDGPNCSNFKPIEYAAKFDGTAYVVFSADDFPHLTSEREETVSFRVKTTAKYGVIFWQGQQPDSAIVGEDYISIGLNDGYLVYSYELGGGAAQIVSTIPINDGKEHVIRVVRRGRNGTLIVDNEPVIRGTSSGILAMLNVEGDVYIGGVPDLQLMTAGLHSHNFVGCVADVLLNHVKMDLMANAIDGVNVKPCDSWRTARRRWMKSKKYRKLVIG